MFNLMKSQPVRLASAAARAFSTTSEVCTVFCQFTVATLLCGSRSAFLGALEKMASAYVLPNEMHDAIAAENSAAQSQKIC